VPATQTVSVTLRARYATYIQNLMSTAYASLEHVQIPVTGSLRPLLNVFKS
jgi:hypothetical protein